MIELQQTWPETAHAKPIVIFGAGSIVADAHLPAYRKAGLIVRGIYDPNHAKAEQLASEWGCIAYRTLEQATNHDDVIFDLATPPAVHIDILSQGNDLGDATRILKMCTERQLKAAVNFQLRFAPMSLALKSAIDQGLLGDVVDFDAWLALDTPWHMWKFLEGLPRVEISLHSIHYLDLVRSILGNPLGIHARTMGHPASQMAQTRTSAMLDYGDQIRCNLSINHDHAFGRKFQACEFRICGTQGAAYMKLGVNLDYPKGEPDELWIRTGDTDWQQIELVGEWFPDAFVARMLQLQRFASGEDSQLISSVQDAWHTMALVEAAYASSSAPMTPIPSLSEITM
jgi:predicted dehydrogenase